MATDTKIVLKRSDVSTAVPNLEYLQFGELAFNYRDEKLYYRSYDVNGTTEIIKNYDFQRIVPIAKGGTGATTAAAARTNLEAAAIFSPAFLGTPSLAAAATQPTIAISTSDADAQRALATVAYVRAEIADDAPTKTGGGASGTSWAIGITGNAATASKWAAPRSITSNNTAAGSDITFNVSLDGSGNVTPTLAINTNRVSNIQTALSLVPGTNIQAYDADLKAIADLTGTSGLLRKTAADIWSLDTTTYTPIARTVTITTGNGITGGGIAQSLGANLSWTLGLTDTGVTAATYNDNATTVTPFAVDAKGRITGTGTPVTITPHFDSITDTPTTLAGYGILDALNTSAIGQAKAGSLTASSFIKSGGTSSQFLKADGSSDGTSYTPTARTLTLTTGNGITGGAAAATLGADRSWTFGLTGQALSVHNLATNGFFVRESSTTVAARSIAVGSGLTISNPDGVSGNPTITLTTSNLTALRDLSTTGFLTRTGSNTLSAKSIAVSGVGLSITNADGVAAGNPTINSNATSTNTLNTIVARDASGNFAAGAITGSSFIVSGTVNTTLAGSATGTAKTLTLPNKDGTIAITDDIPSHASGANTTISAANGRVLSAITVNALGHTTSVSSKDLAAADIPSLDASKITTGTFAASLITDATVTGKVLTGFTAALLPSIPMLSETDTILGAFQKLVPSISMKANTASPTFTGSVTLPTGSASAAPLKFVSGTNLTTVPVAGSVEFNGTNLFITNSALSRKTIAYTDSNITGNAATATTATRLATARTISNPAAPNNNSDINFSYSFDGNANVETNFTINTERASNIRSALGLAIGPGGIQAYDADLAAIAALADGPDDGTAIDTGFLRKTGENTWAIDPNIAPIPGEEVTTITGDVVGSSGIGDRNIVATLATVPTVTAGTYNDSATAITPFTVDAKGRVTSTGSAVTITPSWSSIPLNTRPTTLSGYGITDAQALNSNLTSISTFTGTHSGILQRGLTGAWTLDPTSYTPTARTLTIAGAANSGLTVTPTATQSLAGDRSWTISLEAGNLTQLRDLGTNTGIITHNGTTGGGMVTRSIASGNTAEITITNGNGVSGNPTISLTTSNLTSLRALTTNGFLAHTGTNTITPRSIVIAPGSTGLSITDGNGVLGNPTLTLSSTSTNTNSSLVARDSSGNFAANTITANIFSGSLSGTAETSAKSAVVATDTTNATYGIIFASGPGLSEMLRTDLTGLNYNPSTNTLSASTFNGGATLSGTPTAPTAAVSTNSTQIATTAFVLGQAADGAPPMDGIASAGSTPRFARADHVHPTDTTRAPLASPTFTGTATAPTVSAGNYLVTGNSTTASGAAVQRVLSKSIPVGNIARLAEFTAAEGNVAIEIQVSSNTNSNSGTSTYIFQGGYLSLQGTNPATNSADFYRLYPFSDGRGHGEGTDTGLATTPWMVMIYQVQHSSTTGGYGVAIVNSSATVARSVTVTITELRRGMSFTDRSADSTVSFGTSAGNLYSHTNLLVGNRIGVGKVPTTALDVNGTIAATNLTLSGNLTVNGTTTTLNSNDLTIDDKNITLGSVAAITGVSGNIEGTTTTTSITGIASTSGMIPGQTLTKIGGSGAFGGTTTITDIISATVITITSTTANTAGALVFDVGGATDVTANGGGLTLKGATDKTFNWVSSTAAWTSSEDLNLASGKVYEINSTPVLSSTQVLGKTIESTNTANAIVARDASGNFSANSITASADSFINSIRIGKGAGTDTSLNTAVGVNALLSNTSGWSNTSIGASTLRSNTTGNQNVAVGGNALYSNTTGGSNNAVGGNALYSNTTGGSNNAFGGNALYFNTTGWSNNAFGGNALVSNTTGSRNNAFGVAALYSNTTGNDNTAIGWDALRSNTTGSYNNAFGENALYSNTSGSYNNAFGESALDSNTTGTFNTAFGFRALRLNTTGNDNTAFGVAALYSNTTGNDNTAIGWDALYSNTVGYGNVALGENALRSNTSGYYNIAIGPEALRSNTTSSRNYRNIAIGADAMRYVNSDFSYHNIAIGFNAIGNVNATYSQENIAIGVSALSGNNVNGLNSTQCVVIGNYAFQKAWGSGSSVVIGYSAGYNTYDGQSTVAIGHNALYSNTSGDQNTVIGQGALYSNTTGNRNVAIGAGAGSGITTGGNNILIGVAACPLGAYTGSGNVVIAPGNAAGSANAYPSSPIVNDEVTIANGAGRGARFQGASASAWSWVSDARDKRNITDIDLGLEFINQLQPRKFEWNHRTGKSGNGEYAVGFIAQELLDVVENNNASHTQLVSTDNPDQYTVAETNLIPILVNAIKELSAELKSVKEELAKIK